MYKRVGSYFIMNSCIYHESDLDKIMFKDSDKIEKKVYEVIRIFKGQPIFIEDHIDRLRKSIESINQTNALDFLEGGDIDKLLLSVIQGIKELIKKEGLFNHNIRIEVHLGQVLDVYIFPVYTIYPPLDLYNEGVLVKSYVYSRHMPQVKAIDTAYVDLMIKLKKEYNAFEIVLKNMDGKISEGSRSSIMFIKENMFITPKSENILDGITRKNVISFIKSKGYIVIEKDVYQEDIQSMDGAFLMGTSLNILPIKQFDETVFNMRKESLVSQMSQMFYEHFFLEIEEESYE